MKHMFLLSTLFIVLLAAGCSKEETSPTAQDPYASSNMPSEGLVAYYPFNGNANDESGHGGNGTVTNATLANDRFGRANAAYYFNGTDAKISSAIKYFSASNRISVSLWLKASVGRGMNYFAMCSDFGVFSQDSIAGLAISLPNTNSANGPIKPNGWSHFVGTYDGSMIRVYTDGQARHSVTWAGTIADLNRNLVMGEFSSTYWQGTLDDFRIYNRVLTVAEIQTLSREGGWTP